MTGFGKLVWIDMEDRKIGRSKPTIIIDNKQNKFYYFKFRQYKTKNIKKEWKYAESDEVNCRVGKASSGCTAPPDHDNFQRSTYHSVTLRVLIVLVSFSPVPYLTLLLFPLLISIPYSSHFSWLKRYFHAHSIQILNFSTKCLIDHVLDQVTVMRLKVDLQCHKCYKKVKKILSKFPRECQILNPFFFLF